MKDLAINSIKLVNHLDSNRLLQANAVTCKMEAVLKNKINHDISLNDSVVHEPQNDPDNKKDTPSNKPRLDEHPHWQSYRALNRIQQYILSGTQKEALNEAITLMNKLTQLPKITPK